MLGDSEVVTLKFAFREGATFDWALYVAPGDWDDQRALYDGAKLPEDVARPLARRLAELRLLKRDWSVLTYRD